MADFGLAGNVGRQEPENVTMRAIDDESSGERLCYKGFAAVSVFGDHGWASRAGRRRRLG